MEEIWKVYKVTNPGFPGQYPQRVYEVSNFGRVKKNRQLINLENDYKSKGYYRFASGYAVHRAVAELFIPNPENKPYVDHIDGNKHNNHVNNLRWVTPKENMNNPNTKQQAWNKNLTKNNNKIMKQISINTSKARKLKKCKWMTNGVDNKQVPEIEQQKYLDQGYYFGRIMK